MTKLTNRNIEILKIIVLEYIETWDVLWSKLLLQRYNLWVSPATVRNDMAKLELLDLVYQPYNSAWRLPTSKGLRAFVNYLMQQSPDYFLQKENDNINWKNILKLSDFTYKITYELAKNTKEIAFFIIPDEHIIQYCWVWNFLERNYKRLWNSIFSIVKMLEDKYNFVSFIHWLPKNNNINILIWEENILHFLKDYTIIFKSVIIQWNKWYIWIIWTLKMNYSFNISAIRGII